MCKLLKSKIFTATRLYIGIRLRAPGLKYRVQPTLHPAVHPFRPFPYTSLSHINLFANLCYQSCIMWITAIVCYKMKRKINVWFDLIWFKFANFFSCREYLRLSFKYFRENFRLFGIFLQAIFAKIQIDFANLAVPIRYGPSGHFVMNILSLLLQYTYEYLMAYYSVRNLRNSFLIFLIMEYS